MFIVHVKQLQYAHFLLAGFASGTQSIWSVQRRQACNDRCVKVLYRSVGGLRPAGGFEGPSSCLRLNRRRRASRSARSQGNEAH